jgi:hypothetical protein
MASLLPRPAVLRGEDVALFLPLLRSPVEALSPTPPPPLLLSATEGLPWLRDRFCEPFVLVGLATTAPLSDDDAVLGGLVRFFAGCGDLARPPPTLRSGSLTLVEAFFNFRPAFVGLPFFTLPLTAGSSFTGLFSGELWLVVFFFFDGFFSVSEFSLFAGEYSLSSSASFGAWRSNEQFQLSIQKRKILSL